MWWSGKIKKSHHIRKWKNQQTIVRCFLGEGRGGKNKYLKQPETLKWPLCDSLAWDGEIECKISTIIRTRAHTDMKLSCLATGSRKPRQEVDLTLKALLGSGGIAMAAPVICSCMSRDWSAAARRVTHSHVSIVSSQLDKNKAVSGGGAKKPAMSWHHRELKK